MQGMNPSTDDELAQLRARAYGPNADIGADPVAQARLRSLEERLRSVTLPAHAETARSDGEPAAPSDPGTAAPEERIDAEPEPAPIEPGVSMPFTPARVSRRWLVAWGASILVVAVVVGATVFGLAALPPVSTMNGAPQVATLDEPIEVPEWLTEGYFGTQNPIVYSYENLLVVLTTGGSFGYGSECILVVGESAYSSNGAMNGPIYSACGAGVFPAAASLVIDDFWTEDVREAIPEGTALQFVRDGDVVGVFRDDSGATPTPEP